MIPEIFKREIDEMSYEAMLALWRNAPVGHPMFQGEAGNYFAKVMQEKRANISNEDYVAASKRMGWQSS